ncbi:MAG: sulfatase-like hydrolase/transferase [Thioalkalivibrio sp.]|nr:sulfatase-like hydrolase/transferase [Thioalkalivibrio sp.]
MSRAAPSVLWITSDQLRASALPSYGNAVVRTPHLDALAHRAHLFERVHVQHAKCTPSRSAIMSGRYPHLGGHRTLDLPLQSGERNLPETLRRHGYDTQLIGKNHVVSKAFLPEVFDRHFLPEGSPNDDGDDGSVRRGDPLWGAFYRGEARRDLEDMYDARLAREAIRWLTERSETGGDAPFFTWLTFEAPHPPFRVCEPFFSQVDRASVEVPPLPDFTGKPSFLRLIREIYGLDRLTDDEWREVIATYYGMVAFVDHLVGDVLAALEATGLAEETIVVFHADHGEFLGEQGVIEKWDTAFYDCLTHVPFLIAEPGARQGHRHAPLVESIDFMPTLLELCGVPIPAGTQGLSLTPLMRGERATHRESVLADGGWERALEAHIVDAEAGGGDYVFKHMVRNADPTALTRVKMVRTDRYKLVFRLNGEHELYDLADDPGELRNRHADPDFVDVVGELERLLLMRLIEADEVLPVSPNPRA